MDKTISLTINGEEVKFLVGHGNGKWMVSDEETLSFTLRERMDLTGTKEACGQGACGCCTVLMDNKAVPSCQVLTADCDGKNIVTIEGLQDPTTGKLDPVQEAFIKHYAFQCGFCTPGTIMAVKELLLENPDPSEDEIKEALSGNQCRCISQYHVLEAVKDVVAEVKKGQEGANQS